MPIEISQGSCIYLKPHVSVDSFEAETAPTPRKYHAVLATNLTSVSGVTWVILAQGRGRKRTDLKQNLLAKARQSSILKLHVNLQLGDIFHNFT